MIWFSVNWWVILAGLVPLFFLTAFLHEISHGLVAKRFGWGFKIYVYPHKLGDQWYFARTDFETNGIELTDAQMSYIFYAPRLVNSMFFVAGFLLLHAMPETWYAVKTIFLLLSVGQVIDATVGVIPIFCWWERRDWTDIWRFQKYSGWLLKDVRILFGFMLGMLYFLIFLPLK